MHYLKCNECGHFNEVKTEYMVLCSKCMKKLTNSYSVWQAKNSDGSFDDFKKLVCTTSTAENIVTSSNSNKPKGLKHWLIFGIVFALFSVGAQFGSTYLIGLFNNSQFDKTAMAFANEINKSCPIMIDQGTRLDNSITLPGKIFQYNYTLINFIKDSIDFNGLKANIEPRILNYVKTNPQMKFVRDNNFTINYYYSDKFGIHLFTISVKPEQYQ